MNDFTANPSNNQLTKTCSNGDDCIHPEGPTLPITADYWHRRNASKDGWQMTCKACRNQYQRRRRESNPDYQRQWQQSNREKTRQYSLRWYYKNSDKVAKMRKEQYGEQREYFRQYYRDNRERLLNLSRLWYKNNREHKKRMAQIWLHRNPEKARAIWLRRRARKRSLPDTFTAKDWQRCLDYFNHCCAVCGQQLRDLFGNVEPHADHWLPLSDTENCPGTIPANMVCLCNKCNKSKSVKPPGEWLAKQYSPRKAAQIMQRIQDYFDTLA